MSIRVKHLFKPLLNSVLINNSPINNSKRVRNHWNY